jgi:hypothetical protein
MTAMTEAVGRALQFHQSDHFEMRPGSVALRMAVSMRYSAKHSTAFDVNVRNAAVAAS